MAKKMTISVLSVTLILCMALSSSAIIIMPLWDNASRVQLDIAFSSGTASTSACVTGKSGTTRISATTTLEKQSGSKYAYVDSWSGSTTGDYLEVTGSANGIERGTYRLTCVAHVTRNGTTETVTSSITKTY